MTDTSPSSSNGADDPMAYGVDWSEYDAEVDRMAESTLRRSLKREARIRYAVQEQLLAERDR